MTVPGVPPFTHEHFFLVIGHICIYFSTLDFFVTAVILVLVDRKRYATGFPVGHNATLGQKLRFLKELSVSDVTNAEVLKDIQASIDGAILVSKKRNRFIHDQLVFSPDEVAKGNIERVKLKIKKDYTFDWDSEKINMRDLYDLLGEIGHYQGLYGQFINRLNSPRTRCIPNEDSQ